MLNMSAWVVDGSQWIIMHRFRWWWFPPPQHCPTPQHSLQQQFPQPAAHSLSHPHTWATPTCCPRSHATLYTSPKLHAWGTTPESPNGASPWPATIQHQCSSICGGRGTEGGRCWHQVMIVKLLQSIGNYVLCDFVQHKLQKLMYIKLRLNIYK